MTSDPLTETAPRARIRGRLDLVVGLVVALVLLAIFLESPRRIFLDSRFAYLTSEALLDRGSFDLSPYMPWHAEKVAQAEEGARPRIPYQLVPVGDRLVYYYPVGTSALTLPFVPLMRLLGETSINPEGFYTASGERSAQAVVAALVAAMTAFLVFRIARKELSTARAAALTLVMSLGSGIWSVASRTLWSHSWGTFMAAAVWLELLRWEEGRKPRPVLLGALLSAAFWIRPTAATLIAPVTLFVLWRYRRQAFWMIGTGAMGLLLYLGASMAAWGAPMPRYMNNATVLFRQRAPVQAAFGFLFSPGRGLVPHTPVLLLVPWLLARFGVGEEKRRLLGLGVAVLASTVLLYCGWFIWWGGGSVGPRFACELTPILGWMLALGWRRQREADAARPPRRIAVGLRASVAALLVLASLAAQAPLALDTSYRLPAKRTAKDRQPISPERQRSNWWNWRSLPQGRVFGLLGIDPGIEFTGIFDDDADGEE